MDPGCVFAGDLLGWLRADFSHLVMDIWSRVHLAFFDPFSPKTHTDHCKFKSISQYVSWSSWSSSSWSSSQRIAPFILMKCSSFFHIFSNKNWIRVSKKQQDGLAGIDFAMWKLAEATWTFLFLSGVQEAKTTCKCCYIGRNPRLPRFGMYY